MEDKQIDVVAGDCYECPYYDKWRNYCIYYTMELIGNGYEQTCRNQELKQKTNER